MAVERGELLVLRASRLDDAPLIRCKLTSHDAEKLWHRAATWRETRGECRREGGRRGVRAKEREEDRGRRMEAQTEGKERMEMKGKAK